MKSPDEYYNAILDIENEIEKNIHDLVIKYGKHKVTKKYGSQYILTIPKYKRCFIRINSEIDSINKIIVSNPEDCQEMGHTFFISEHGKTYNYTLDLEHQGIWIYNSICKTLNMFK